MERVVIVDDEEWVRYFLANSVDWAGIGAVVAGEAAGGEQALKICTELRPDLVITDIRMPGMDGVELFRTLRARFPHTKTIVISGHDQFEYARSAVNAGVCDYLLKPVSRDELRTVVGRVLEVIRAEKRERRDRESARKEILKLRDAVLDDAVPDTTGKPEVSGAVERAVNIITERYAEPLTLTGIADAVFLNPRYLSTIFKEKTGRGFKEFLLDVRMEHARTLLLRGGLTVKEVAALVGFDDAHYFSRVFLRVTGVLPRDYRETVNS